MEGAERAAAGEDEGGAAEGVARLAHEVELVAQAEVGALVAAQRLQVALHLLDVLPDGLQGKGNRLIALQISKGASGLGSQLCAVCSQGLHLLHAMDRCCMHQYLVYRAAATGASTHNHTSMRSFWAVTVELDRLSYVQGD